MPILFGTCCSSSIYLGDASVIFPRIAPTPRSCTLHADAGGDKGSDSEGWGGRAAAGDKQLEILDPLGQGQSRQQGGCHIFRSKCIFEHKDKSTGAHVDLDKVVQVATALA
jgi:hypothetical protein